MVKRAKNTDSVIICKCLLLVLTLYPENGGLFAVTIRHGYVFVNSIFRRLICILQACFLFTLFGVNAVLPFAVYAQPSSEQVDAVLVLDVSGSMLLTDPLNLRQEGAKLFTQFLKKGDRLAIVTFSDEANVLRTLEPFDPSQQSSINSLISQAGASGEFTNLAAGIDKAVSILKNNQRDKATQTIILMSDGKMEPSPIAESAAVLSTRLAEDTLPELKKSGVKLYTLAFSDQADKDLLQEFAALTDGISWFTPSAEKIHESFANLFLAVKKPQIAPQTKKGFKLDSDVQEATFYINREGETDSIAIIRPDGSTIDSKSTSNDIKWFKGKQFDVVTVMQPQSGDWQITGVANQEGFATLLTKLRLVSEWPTNLYAQEKIVLEVRLYEEDKPISLPEMSGIIQFAFQVTPTDKVSEPIIRDFLQDDGKDGDRIAKDGIFSKTIEVEDPGEYKLRVLAKAPTFERNQQIPFRVKAPLVRVNIIGSSAKLEKLLAADQEEESANDHGASHDSHVDTAEEDGHQGDKPQIIEVALNEDVGTFKKFNVKLVAVDSSKSRYELPLSFDKLNKTKRYASVAMLPKADKYTFQAILSGETKRSQIVRSESKPIIYNYEPKGAHIDEVKVVKKVDPGPRKEKPASPVIPIILMTLLSAGATFGIFKFLSKSTVNTDSKAPEFPPFDDVEQLIVNLQQKILIEDVDMTLPFLASIDEPLPQIWDVGVVETQVSDSTVTGSSDGSEHSEGEVENSTKSTSDSEDQAAEPSEEDSTPKEES